MDRTDSQSNEAYHNSSGKESSRIYPATEKDETKDTKSRYAEVAENNTTSTQERIEPASEKPRYGTSKPYRTFIRAKMK